MIFISKSMVTHHILMWLFSWKRWSPLKRLSDYHFISLSIAYSLALICSFPGKGSGYQPDCNSLIGDLEKGCYFLIDVMAPLSMQNILNRIWWQACMSSRQIIIYLFARQAVRRELFLSGRLLFSMRVHNWTDSHTQTDMQDDFIASATEMRVIMKP